MPILAIATSKGGAGKTTLAACLAEHWGRSGRKVMCLARTRTATSKIGCAAGRQACPALRSRKKLCWMPPNTDWVIVDVAGYLARGLLYGMPDPGGDHLRRENGPAINSACRGADPDQPARRSHRTHQAADIRSAVQPLADQLPSMKRGGPAPLLNPATIDDYESLIRSLWAAAQQTFIEIGNHLERAQRLLSPEEFSQLCARLPAARLW